MERRQLGQSNQAYLNTEQSPVSTLNLSTHLRTTL
jgi:hypothetical protein